MKKSFVCLLAVIAFGAFDTGVLEAQTIQWTDHISCLGERGICVRFRRSPTSNVWHKRKGIRHHEDPYPWGFGRVCPEGNESVDNIFIFDPESETTGIGYIGLPVCANDEAGQYALTPQPNTQVYTNVTEWENALLVTP